MPAYDYKCEKCGCVFEVEQKITEDPLKHCPKCNGKVKRLFSAAGIVFKGSGFHVTDYAKHGKPSSHKSSPPKDSKSK